MLLYLRETVAGTSTAQWDVTVEWNDEAGAQQLGTGNSQYSSEGFQEQPVRFVAGQPLTYLVTGSPPSGSQYEFIIAIEQLTSE